jgi:hypothetical protein
VLTICIVCIIKLTTTHVCEYVGYDGFIGGVSSVNIGLYIDMNQHKVGAMT